jgi:nitroimidazol reductase NimA-like FMN-containing flavoprotein (pyridoxamine 5'-phosphate oxidase superfamily)
MPAAHKPQDRLEAIKYLIRDNSLCVLATASADRPHCSLMAYVVNEECTEFCMATPRDSKKYRNLVANAQVSLLIDNRDRHGPTTTPETKALTVGGVFRPLSDGPELDPARSRLLARHPEMAAFFHHADTVVFSVKVESYQLLEGIAESSFITV